MSILILKFWYVACAIFCLYNLNTLVRERYEVTIIAASENKTDHLILLICQKLSSFQLNRTEILLEDLRDQLIERFNSSKYRKQVTKRRVLDQLKTGQYLIFNSLICLHLKDKWEWLNMNDITEPVFLAFKSSTLDFVQITSPWKPPDQLIVQMRGPPYSNCNQSNGRFFCLNECFKNNFRLSQYFYGGNETGTIHLKPATNETIEKSERSCFRECQRENCEMVQLSPIPGYQEPRIITLETHPKLSEFDFWIQFLGLVCSFANVSLNQLASMTIQFVSSKVKRRRVRIGLLCLKWATLFFSLTFCSYLYTTMTFDYKADQRNPPRKEITRNQIKQKTVHLAICGDINPNLLLSKTMSEIEKATDGTLDDHLKSIHLNYQGRLFRVDYITGPEVLFKKFLGIFDIEIFSRCFSLLILPDYQAMPSNPKLTILLKVPPVYLKIYFLTENENLNEGTFEFTEKAFMKRVVKRLESGGCVNYRERYGNCTSRRHCVERCINRRALDKFKKIPIDKAVVDKDQFSPEEWRTTYPVVISNMSPYVHPSTYANFSKECEEIFPDEPPCVEVQFNETAGIFLPDVYTMEIDLFLDVELSIEELSWFNLLLNIMSTHTTFFSINVFTLLRILHSFLKPKMRMGNEKIALFLIYLLCSIGFTYHTYRILDLSINGDLSYSPDYEIVNRVRMPVLVFCFPIEEKLIDANHQLTGNYLEQLTSDMRAESVFKSIIYLNESNEWTSFNLSLVESFFFTHSKCFRITIHREYKRRQFHFSENKLLAKVLKVNFTNKFWNEEKNNIFFITKTNETTRFSNVANLFYSDREILRYSAEQSELTIKYEDHLRFIRRFFSTSGDYDFNDLDEQLPELKSSKFSFRTLKVPVEKEDFDFELRDDLFEQLSAQIETETTSNSLGSLDYQKTSVFNQLKEADDFPDSDFFLSLSLIKKTQSAKNEAKLILGLLNVLFWFDLGILDLHPIFVYFYAYLLVWLPIYLIDKITQFLIFSHRWLKKFEAPLYKRLDSRKQIVRQTSQV